VRGLLGGDGHVLMDLEHRQANIFVQLRLGKQINVGLVMGEGFLFLTELMVFEGCEVQIGGGEFRIGSDTLLQPVLGLRELVFAGGDNAQAVEGVGGIGVGLQMPLERVLSLTPRGNTHVGEAKLVIGVGGRSAARHDLSEVGDSVVGLTTLQLGEREIVACGNVAGIEPYGVLQVPQAGFHLALLKAAGLTVHQGTRDVSRGVRKIALTRTEYSILELLIRNAGRVVTRAALMEGVWGNESEIESNTLDAFVRLLRAKVEEPGKPRLIRTVRGVGYVLDGEET